MDVLRYSAGLNGLISPCLGCHEVSLIEGDLVNMETEEVRAAGNISDILISVIIPHYQDLDRLSLCLDAVLAQKMPPGTSFEIVVADNASPAGFAEVNRRVAGRAKLVEVTRQGAGPARNGGVAASRGEILAFTDCDCLPAPGWLKTGLAALGNADIVGGRMEVLIARAGSPTPVEAFEQVFAFHNRDYVERQGFTVTANLFVRRADFDRVGPFRTGVSEDLEWCSRARGLGLRLAYAENAAVGHPARRTWPELVAKWRRIIAELYQFNLTKPYGRLLWILRSWALPFSIFAHAPRVIFSSSLPDWSSKCGALRILIQARLWRFIEHHRLLMQRKHKMGE